MEALAYEEIEKLQREGVSERELLKAKNQIRSAQIMGRQRVYSKSEMLQHFRRFHGDPSEVNRDLDRYMAVTVDEIREMARKYLTPQNRTVVTVVPRQATSAADSTTPVTGQE